MFAAAIDQKKNQKKRHRKVSAIFMSERPETFVQKKGNFCSDKSSDHNDQKRNGSDSCEESDED